MTDEFEPVDRDPAQARDLPESVPSPTLTTRSAVVMAIATILILVGTISVLIADGRERAAYAGFDAVEVDACFTNQRAMEGAALVYLNRTGTVADDIRELGLAYEQTPPRCPAGGTYEFLTTGPYVSCSTHGSFVSAFGCAGGT